MTWKDARKIVDARREQVAHLRLRGLTVREIVEALPKQNMVNNETGEPYALATIGADIRALNKQWRENAQLDIAAHKAAQLAELAEVKRAAWASKRYDTVLRAMEREAKLLGMDAPTKTELTGKDGSLLTVRFVYDDGGHPAAPAPLDDAEGAD